MRKIAYHPFPLAATIMFQDILGGTMFASCVAASCNRPAPAVCTLLGLFLCCAMSFAGTGMATSLDQDDNVMPVFRDK